jgi:diguanylate cyclase (GGDEF)-like protein
MPDNSKIDEAAHALEEHIKETGGKKAAYLIDCLQAVLYDDSLTGIFNRKFFDRILPIELSASARAGQPHAILFVDNDNLKAINDDEGHQKGDEAIRNTALSLKNNLRTSDIVCRNSTKADEFLALLRSTSTRGAYMTADEIRRLIADDYAFTISGGVTSSDVVGVPMLYGERGRDTIAAFLDSDGVAERTMARINEYCSRSGSDKNKALVMLKNVYDFIRLQQTAGVKAPDLGKDFEEIAARAIVHYADNAMLKAKQAGKNRIRAYDFGGLGHYTESGVWIPIRMSK